jgi:hypothetical protein
MAYVVTEVEVDVNLEEFSDEEIIEEFELRMLGDSSQMSIFKSVLTEIYQLRRLGKSYENELNKMICDALGVVI